MRPTFAHLSLLACPRVIDARPADQPPGERLPEAHPSRGDELSQAQQALAESLEERNRLWAELQRLKALQHENEYLQGLLSGLESSLSWRITKPLRDAMQYGRNLSARLRPTKQD